MNKEQLQDIFRQPYNAGAWQELLINLFLASEIRQTPSTLTSDSNEKVEGFELGRLNTADRYEIGLFAFDIKGGMNLKLNRVGLRSLVKSYTRLQVDAAIVVFYDSTHWRLSFICDIPKEGEKTDPKRYTYVFGNPDESYRTASDMLAKLSVGGKPSFENIKAAFSVEALSSDFFKGYKERYLKFKGTFEGEEQKWHRDFVKKMMGRLVFLQFLQKKGWLNGDYNYLQNLYTTSEHKGDFLEHILEPLFFGVLNTKPEDREQLFNKNGWSLSLLEQWISIPYLNGGLFEEDVLDKKRVVFPAALFENLFEFFSHYNFTIDENDPNDAEVGIDPEMLGHIFENLLEDNKDKGAFYTPKEIVQYMCRESLIQYLNTHNDQQWHDHIKMLVYEHKLDTSMQGNRAFAESINRLLRDVKICDPAIGSGAFPMGLLNEIFAIRRKLYPEIGTVTQFVDAEIKKEIIQNNIYGVDIEQGAVDIARLRFWLSLVVDEDKPQPLPNLDYKIVCGNSLITTFDSKPIDLHRQQGLNSKKIKDKKRELYTLQSEFYNLNGSEKHTKEVEIKRCLLEIIELQIDYKLESNKQNQATSLSMFEPVNQVKKVVVSTDLGEQRLALLSLKTTLFGARPIEELSQIEVPLFDWEIIFSDIFSSEEKEKRGFDIVIGNPPYLRIQGIRDTNPMLANELVKRYKSATGSFDLYATFAERGLQIINPLGVVNYIMPVKWTNAAFGKGLRGVVSENNSACKIINFGAYQVFNASTYTALQWFKPNCDALSYVELDRNLNTNQELGLYLNTLADDTFAKLPASKLKSDAWVLTVGDTTKLLNRLEEHPRRMKDIFDKIFQGLATSKDDVYFLYKCREEGDIVVGYSKYLEREVRIERGLVKPLLKGEDVHRYDNISTDRFVVFPYILGDGKANLYAEKQLSELFPLGYSYLKECEDVLREREKGRFNIDGEWFQFGRKQGILSAETEKLVAPEISLGGNFAYDIKGEFYSTTKIYGYIKKENIKESYKFWLGLFNSRLFWFYLQNTGYVLRGGYFTFKTNYINPFPVPAEINPDIDDMVSNLVDMLIYLFDGSNPDIFDHTANKRVRVHIEDVLNMIIYELYFGEHMKEKGIDVIADLKGYKFNNSDLSKEIERFYTWYQKSENMIRQKLMLLDTRSNELIYLIHTSAAL